MPRLVHSLFALLLRTPESDFPARDEQAIVGSDERSFLRALDQLAPHKVFPLLAFQLARFALWERVPAAARARLTEMHDEVRARNVQLMLTTARLVRQIAQRGEAVVLMKGILFADTYYPDASTRPMSDIDLVAVRGRDQALFTLLGEAGFRPSLHHGVQAQSITFMNREGVFCDAHRRLTMFDRVPWPELALPVELRRVRGVKALALEPNAMVAHLAAHMHGHAPEMGLVLLWIVDLGLVLRRHRDGVSPSRVRRLIDDDDGAWALLLRLVRLLGQSGIALSPAWQRATRAVPTFSLAAALRQRRITPWGLPGLLGWARLVAHELGLHRAERPPPLASDLVLWPCDQIAAKVASPLARRAR